MDNPLVLWNSILARFVPFSNHLKKTILYTERYMPFSVYIKALEWSNFTPPSSYPLSHMKYLLAFVLTFSVFALRAQTAQLVKVDQLKQLIEKPSDQIQVINFWATWCAPCIKEMPLFEKLGQSRPDVAVTLVSVDLDLDRNPAKVHKFVERKKLTSTVYILDEKDPNVWIDVIEKSWQGAIPATLIVNTKTGKRTFVDKELHEGDLEKLIDRVR